MNNRFKTGAFGSAILLLAVTASAGVIMKREGGPVGGDKMQSVVYIEGAKVRVESAAAMGKTVIIFDGDKQVMWIVQPDNSYMEMTADSIARMAQMAGGGGMSGAQNAQMEAAMQRQQAALANLPPEQRAMAEQAMKGRMGAMGGGASSGPVSYTYEARGGSGKYGQFTCTKYDQMGNGKKSAEMCLAPTSELRLSANDMRAFQAMSKFMEPMRRMNPRASQMATFNETMPGFPVHSLMFDASDKPTYEDTLLSVEQKSVEGAMFTLPAGATKRDMMGGRGGRP